jgi:hypothetical protein
MMTSSSQAGMAGGGDLTVEQVAELTGMGVKWQWLRAQVSQRGLKKWAGVHQGMVVGDRVQQCRSFQRQCGVSVFTERAGLRPLVQEAPHIQVTGFGG